MLQDEHNALIIQTPEGVSFSLALAGPAIRFFAWAIDMMCIAVVAFVLGPVFSLLRIIQGDWATAIFIISYFVLSIGYGICLEWFWRGQTLGKKLLRLRVVDENGLRLDPSQIIIRNLLRFVDGLPVFYLVGGIACFVSRRNQRLGDYAANTIVIRNQTPARYDFSQAAPDKFNSFRNYPHVEHRLRQQVAPREAAIALEAVMRRDQFDPPARVELFAELAAHFKEKAAFPEEAAFGLTDEQYVRNIVDSLFRH